MINNGTVEAAIYTINDLIETTNYELDVIIESVLNTTEFDHFNKDEINLVCEEFNY